MTVTLPLDYRAQNIDNWVPNSSSFPYTDDDLIQSTTPTSSPPATPPHLPQVPHDEFIRINCLHWLTGEPIHGQYAVRNLQWDLDAESTPPSLLTSQ